MKFTDDYLKQAEKLLMDLFLAERPELLKAHGNVEHELKGDTSPVTELDKSVEAAIRKALQKFDPSVGLVGEELGKDGNDKTYWLLDPIDDTEGFIRGLPTPRNVVTLVDDGQLIYTITYKFVTDEKFTAIRGQGAFRNGQRIHVSDRPMNKAWIEYATDLSNPKLLKKYLAIRPHIHGYYLSRDFTFIATGKIDGMIWDRQAGGPWDYAPRALLYQEAGAKVTNVGSDGFDFNVRSMITAGPQIFDELTKLYNES